MGMCLEDFGRVSVEVRRESFVVHSDYGEDDSPEMRPLGSVWRELPHPEFLLSDLDDIIKALEDARDYIKNGRKR